MAKELLMWRRGILQKVKDAHSRAAIVVAAIVLLTPALQLADAGLPSAKASDGNQLSCQDRVIVDYLAPFGKLRPPHPPPPGRLPFEPGSLRLRESALSQVLAQGGSFGYVALLSGGALRRSARLDWQVSASLQRIGAGSRSGRVAARRSWEVRTLKALNRLEFSLRVGPRPSLYRFVLEFRDSGERLLGRFSQYVRSVPRTVKVSLLTDSPTYAPGQTMRTQVANFGSERMSYGGGTVLSSFNGTEWVTAMRFSALRGARRAMELGPGEASACVNLPLPADLPVGRYRVEQAVSTLIGVRRNAVSREFQVTQ